MNIICLRPDLKSAASFKVVKTRKDILLFSSSTLDKGFARGDKNISIFGFLRENLEIIFCNKVFKSGIQCKQVLLILGFIRHLGNSVIPDKGNISADSIRKFIECRGVDYAAIEINCSILVFISFNYRGGVIIFKIVESKGFIGNIDIIPEVLFIIYLKNLSRE